MPVWFAYVDESYDEQHFCLSAFLVRHTEWLECFRKVRSHRQQLKNDHGVFLRKEIHARDLVAGRGNISPKTIGKWQRSRIFFSMLQLTAQLPSVQIFNVCLPTKIKTDPHLVAWDRLVNRLERTMQEFENREQRIRNEMLDKIRQNAGLAEKDYELLEYRLNRYKSRAFIIADEGREEEITKAIRKMHAFNPIPSKFGAWQSGAMTKNITTDHLIEDPVFKQSHRSFFVQLADCVAFALLKKESPPTPRVLKYGIHKMFDESGLASVCYKAASPSDPLGIVRK